MINMKDFLAKNCLTCQGYEEGSPVTTRDAAGLASIFLYWQFVAKMRKLTASTMLIATGFSPWLLIAIFKNLTLGNSSFMRLIKMVAFDFICQCASGDTEFLGGGLCIVVILR